MSDEQVSHARSRIARAANLALSATRGPQHAIQHLATLQSVLEMLKESEVDLIDALHRGGYTWGQIAAVRRTTRQAERQAHLRRQAERDRPAIDRWFDRFMAGERRPVPQQTIPASAQSEGQEHTPRNPVRDSPDSGQIPAVAG